MSVRRLAEASVQPASFAFNKANAAAAKQWIKKYPKGREQSAIIPLLMIAQEQEGWVTKAAIETISDMLGMPRIRGLEVATFYTQYQLNPVGTRAHIQVCGTTPCMLRGSEALMDVCRSKIHHDQFHTNDKGTLSWEEVECLGACVNAPMVMVFKDTFEDLTPERLAEIIDLYDAGKGASVAPGPQNGRSGSEPASGLTTLKSEKAILKSTRDREAREAAKAAKAAPGAIIATAVPAPAAVAPTPPVAPSNASKPKTDAPETSPALKTPSKTKVAPAAEKAASVSAPLHSAANANTTAPEVEKVSKQRNGPTAKAEPASAFKAPEAKVPAAKPAKPSLEDKNRPAGIDRPAAVDDLKLISGVGPKIEGILHTLGVFTFAQVASWKKAEREWVDGYLSFQGRIDRDNWVAQAKALAKGGVAEYIRVFGKKPV
ncbi:MULTISPECIES: NADH-quinone oxidoreductase subunit E [unclassified Mesorhizobium]|uniref:NADH-quinone oxidoreductase subunit E n=1 Tax=unclassified Mesorhizobium TaxID=325217 RepID=UPI000FD7837C|nr:MULTISPECIES: NADH-quinone oxidoreductase subunit E [unclassified Mesorhizobium]TGR41317.1 NADH-quinone oxidoreductase subunit E [bacterium M00.F.Ca.ET.199.01.1.1]TGU31946.1 NADH-quinone oxidoreductase subunit E [bacterium M00.F.Ca.ET.156.01.1.1]TGV86254.1 NADH-quinone oxidoreductase subunit E [Mesorhizobium sp. M00.F.Ca.ET.149.01.1.1]TGR26044.1 NADH-quinone oxidoreductase subunit E [Mesorhizobium sp. M8A.F.Ca.ET.197.01.1.1]TGR26494.1 NADH-quinone oxidoreductase subunit E [Mesorhizobium sp.